MIPQLHFLSPACLFCIYLCLYIYISTGKWVIFLLKEGWWSCPFPHSIDFSLPHVCFFGNPFFLKTFLTIGEPVGGWMKKAWREGTNTVFLPMFPSAKGIPVPAAFCFCEHEMKWAETEPCWTGKHQWQREYQKLIGPGPSFVACFKHLI